MARIDGGEMLVRVLEQEGIRVLFTLHGGHLDAIFQAARGRNLRWIDTRHEQAAGHAADGWARTTGGVGVAVVTAGPGVTDVVTAVTNAYLDCIPTLFIGGAAPLRDAETLPLQGGFDQLDLVRPITKWAHRITQTHRIPELVTQALRVATTGRPGPVFLEFPIDVLFARVDEEKVTFPKRVRPDTVAAPPAAAVERALEWLRQAERPAIMAGGGAWFSGAGAELLAFAERTGIPVFSNGKAHGMVPADHPLCGRGFANVAMLVSGGSAPDVVLLLGARLGLFTGGRGGGFLARTPKLIQVDIVGEEIGRNRDIELAIVADCRETVRAFNAAAGAQPWPDRSKWQQAVRAATQLPSMMFAEALSNTNAPIHPFRMAHAVVQAAGKEAVVVADGGETANWVEMAANVGGGGRWLSHGYLGCLGTGMPFAIAAKVAHPDRPVVCVIGDGSVGLNFAEFDTMVRHKLAIVTVVNNDQQWGMSAHGQDLIFGEGHRVVTDLAPTRYDLAAAGFGCHAEYVERPEDLAPALARAFAAGKPACVNVMTDPSVIAPVTISMVGAPKPKEKKEDQDKVQLPYYADLDQ
ncbi:MAG TPA: thiamine pyrophosphate-binding protein [Candidatus Kryptonia bacterium]|nr:thiamine pyrophosphate-binding protein [Candidatus Kryptonia bacterium]